MDLSFYLHLYCVICILFECIFCYFVSPLFALYLWLTYFVWPSSGHSVFVSLPCLPLPHQLFEVCNLYVGIKGEVCLSGLYPDEGKLAETRGSYPSFNYV